MIEKEIVKVLHLSKIKAEESQLERPKRPEHGEMSFPCFHLAKEMRKSPTEIARELEKEVYIPEDSVVSKVHAEGGYLNFHVNWERFSKIVLDGLKNKTDIGKGEKVMIEYSQPNPVHPIHVGHARSTFLGDSLSNIMGFAGYQPIRANYMNNVGLQVAKLVTAYKTWADGKEPESKPDAWLWKYYIKFHEDVGKDKSLEETARAMLKKYESGDPETKLLWDKIVRWCVDGFEDTYKRMGVNFDIYFYESEFRDAGKKVVEETMRKGISKKTEDGAVFADLEKHGMPGTIIQRSDGTGLYITSDLGLTAYKFSEYKLAKSIWVVSSQQDLNFQQLFKIFELVGYKFYKDCYHFSYEWVKLQEGNMSSREGRAIMMDDVLEKLTQKALAEVKKRNPHMELGRMRKIAEQIAVGALRYSIIRIEPHKQIVFDWDRMLSLDGNTGPYLQYAHTRCVGILNKAGKFERNMSYGKLNDQEKDLLKKLSKFGIVIEEAVREVQPHVVCNYGYELADALNSFYHTSPVVASDSEDQKNFRLTLVESTKETLEKIFSLIGMEAPGKM